AHGTATAASLWATACIGVAVAWNHFEVALLLSLLTFASLWLLSPAKGAIKRDAPPTDDS
ncbi:MAG TPA: MgtC/SapB family protein, partial [Chromatiales bacterium]|nr:MgtC/SapB family protein [Chromatiales bacterium]